MEEHPLRNLLGKALLTTEGQAFRLQGLRHQQLATSAMDDGRRAHATERLKGWASSRAQASASRLRMRAWSG
jgi:hypothetical protein